MEDRKEQKARLRRKILKERNDLPEEIRGGMDKRILKRLIRLEEEEPCSAYLCYVNYKSEVSTKEFILWCLEQGKLVFAPKVKTEAKPAEMEFYQIHAWEELKTGYQGILEPEALPERAFYKWLAATEKETGDRAEKIPLRMLLPGAVFDKKRNRIGYGGGFYDRWLAGWEHVTGEKPVVLEKIGLAYEMQVVDVLPAERFDKKVDRVITE